MDQCLKCYCDWYFILINPQESFEVVTIIAGIIITATGIIDFIYYLNGWLDIYFMKNTLLSGFLKCTLGIFVLTHIPLMTIFFSLYLWPFSDRSGPFPLFYLKTLFCHLLLSQFALDNSSKRGTICDRENSSF